MNEKSAEERFFYLSWIEPLKELFFVENKKFLRAKH